MDSGEDLRNLERAAELELAKLGVAEHLGWWLAAFAATSAHLQWDSWLATVIVFFAAYVLATLRYRRAESLACDAFERAAKVGKYARLD